MAAADTQTNPILWQPSPEAVAQTNMMAMFGDRFSDYPSAWQWSVDEPEAFWTQMWDFAGIIGTRGETVIADAHKMPGARFFPEATLNFAENLLRRDDDGLALWFRGEDQVETKYTFAELRAAVSRLQQDFQALGVQPGDRVAAFMPNMPETVITMLAATSLGAIFCSASPDFGVQGVLDRFGQIQPKVLVACEGYYFKGKAFDCLPKLKEILGQLPTVEKAIIVGYTTQQPDISGLNGSRTAALFSDIQANHDVQPLTFLAMPFNHPLYIMFSSGTTGVPKCIVHGAGGTLLQHFKEHMLHCDVKPDDRIFYFTTCGWMMWNWLVTALGCGACLCLFDGNPFHPGPEVLWKFAEDAKVKLFGTSAKYIDALNKGGFEAKDQFNLDALRVITSTGSPLVPEAFDYVYRALKDDVQLSSISGGTDIVSCFVLGSPITPVRRGEIQVRGLGMDVAIFNDDGQPVVGEKGELVCLKPFPAMPVMFWNDPDGAKLSKAYFEAFPGVWHHGDFCELTETGGLIIYGRSDAVLNPGGVRIGTAEIYRAVEMLDEVVESICIGQDTVDDVRVVLFVILRDGMSLDEDLTRKIKNQIKTRCTPRHMPAVVAQVTDIPRTKSGKITELAVRDIVHGRTVKNVEALANPEALDQFKDRPELVL